MKRWYLGQLLNSLKEIAELLEDAHCAHNLAYGYYPDLQNRNGHVFRLGCARESWLDLCRDYPYRIVKLSDKLDSGKVKSETPYGRELSDENIKNWNGWGNLHSNLTKLQNMGSLGKSEWLKEQGF